MSAFYFIMAMVFRFMAICVAFTIPIIATNGRIAGACYAIALVCFLWQMAEVSGREVRAK